MKKAILVVAVMVSMFAQAQEIEPTFSKVGDMVKATYFHDNGQIAQTGYVLNGKLHGQWLMYDAVGTKIASGKYVEGKRSGKWFFWEGEVLKEVDFKDNRMVSVKNWNTSESVAIN
ncbi:MAG: nicotinic acid mononucleotide adenyltransferase [Flavobacteriaceae bacterium]|nr:nicotinic acid mononucleotide adenyltransferase [Flavobacteriaceae bacterium]